MINQPLSVFLGGPDCGKTAHLEEDMMAISVGSSAGLYHRTNSVDSKNRVIWRWKMRLDRRVV